MVSWNMENKNKSCFLSCAIYKERGNVFFFNQLLQLFTRTFNLWLCEQTRFTLKIFKRISFVLKEIWMR